MKHLFIYFDLQQTIDCPDKPSQAVALKARAKALEVAKHQFTDLISSTFTNQVAISQEQPDHNAILIEVNDKQLEEVLPIIRAMDIVSIIDAVYFPATQPKPPQKLNERLPR